MSISIRPDPAHPQGGHALMSVPAAPATELRLSIHDLGSGRWLGEDGWQNSECELGPYSVGPDGHIDLGPKIVDEMEAYLPLEIRVAGESTRLSWPEAVLPSPTVARKDGGLTVLRREPYGGSAGTGFLSEEIAPPAVPEEPEPHDPPEDRELPKNDQEVEVDVEEDGQEANPTNRMLWFVVLGVLLVAVAGALYFGLWKDESEPPPDAAPSFAPEPDSPVGDRADCSAAGFDAIGEMSIREQMAFARACGAQAAPENLLRVLEAGVGAELPEALIAMGELYDPGVPASGPLVLTRKDPAIAAEYYSRARAAGDSDVDGRLRSVCSLLDPADLLHADAIETYCPE